VDELGEQQLLLPEQAEDPFLHLPVGTAALTISPHPHRRPHSFARAIATRRIPAISIPER
ncbi:MAG TPA: hypothetical protein VEG84_09250, partial [Thermoanaerobaculia bacterium]|nr:hypothetical protein [Thermoanaerobaculia bacterium]